MRGAGAPDARAACRQQREPEFRPKIGVASLYDADQDHAGRQRLGLQRVSLANFRQDGSTARYHDGEHLYGTGAVIAFGVIYNSARISLSERARELASLRVLGFTAAEVLWILLARARASHACSPSRPGGSMGYGLAWIMKTQAGRRTDASTSGGYVVNLRVSPARSSSLRRSISALVIRERINRLDLVAVLKTRD